LLSASQRQRTREALNAHALHLRRGAHHPVAPNSSTSAIWISTTTRIPVKGLLTSPFVTPGFKAKTRCSSYVCLESSCHTYDQNVNTENQCLFYIKIITWDIVFTQKTISTLSSSNSGTHQSSQAINRGQRKLLEEIFIVVVHLIFIF
jgi:hypothetical protein